MIKLLYKDGQNWVDINGNYTNWDTYAEVFKEERIQPNYIASETFTDTWNGEIRDVQHVIRDAWYVEFWIKESQLTKISQLRNCDTVLILDLENDISHTVDMQTSGLLEFNEPERIADTTNWKISFVYQINKKVVNKYNALANQVTLVGGGTHYSKYDKLPYVGEFLETKLSWGEGIEKVLAETNNIGFTVLFYADASGMEVFKNDWNQNPFTIDTVDVIEKLPLEINELGEDNYKIVAKMITSQGVVDNTLALSNEVTLVGGDSTYYSKYEKLPFKDPIEKIEILWGEGGEIVLSETNRVGFQALLYNNATNMEAFKNDWNQNPFTIDTVDIIEKLPLEIEDLETGYYKIILTAITENENIDNSAALSQVTTLVGNSTYSVKYELLSLIQDSEKIEIKWSDGQNILLRETNKTGYDALLYLDAAGMEAFKNDWNQYDFEVNSIDILEKLPLEITKVSSGFYQIIVSGITNIDRVTDVAQTKVSSTHELDIAATYPFYTDYPLIGTWEDTELEQFENQSGVKILAKSIARQVNIFKTWTNENDAQSIKVIFETLEGTTLDSNPVKENRLVSITELDHDLWEVEVPCLMATDVTYY